jgi:hypothetical protein
MVLVQEWSQIGLAPLAAIDDRNLIFGVPLLADADFAATAAATFPVEPLEDAQPHARRDGGVRRLADPFW